MAAISKPTRDSITSPLDANYVQGNRCIYAVMSALDCKHGPFNHVYCEEKAWKLPMLYQISVKIPYCNRGPCQEGPNSI